MAGHVVFGPTVHHVDFDRVGVDGHTIVGGQTSEVPWIAPCTKHCGEPRIAIFVQAGWIEIDGEWTAGLNTKSPVFVAGVPRIFIIQPRGERPQCTALVVLNGALIEFSNDVRSEVCPGRKLDDAHRDGSHPLDLLLVRFDVAPNFVKKGDKNQEDKQLAPACKVSLAPAAFQTRLTQELAACIGHAARADGSIACPAPPGCQLCRVIGTECRRSPFCRFLDNDHLGTRLAQSNCRFVGGLEAVGDTRYEGQFRLLNRPTSGEDLVEFRIVWRQPNQDDGPSRGCGFGFFCGSRHMFRIDEWTMSSIILAVVGALALTSMGDLPTRVGSAIAVLVVWGGLVWVLPRPKYGIRQLVITAALIRGILVFMEPTLSDDVYRYLWEGRVAWAGENPYLQPPASPLFDAWGFDPIRDRVAHPEISAIYPPMAIWLFAVLGQIVYAPWGIKLFMAFADLGVVFVLARLLRRRERTLGPAWLYALHPLGAVESAGSGHMEALGLLCVLAAVDSWDERRGGVAWAALGLWVKLLPGVMIPRLWRGRPWLLLGAMAVGFSALWPFVEAGATPMWNGMSIYVRHWSFNGGLFSLFEIVFGSHARPVAIMVGALLVFRAIRIHTEPERIALWAGGAFVLLSPTVHPWYVLWAWVPALLCGVRSWTLLATLVPLSYAALASYDPMTSSWEEPWWPPLFSTLPFLMALLWESVHRATQPGPWGPGAIARPRRSVSRTEPDTSTLFQR